MDQEPALKVEYEIIRKEMIGNSVLLAILFLAIIRILFYLRHIRRQNILSSNSPPTTTYTEERLDPSVLKSLPIFIYSSSAVHGTLHDCAICLSEYTEGDECRMLPNCNHVFHSLCIDAWFASHSNCPICRAQVQPLRGESHAESSEGNSYFPEPVGCPRRPFRVIVEMPPETSRIESHTRG